MPCSELKYAKRRPPDRLFSPLLEEVGSKSIRTPLERCPPRVPALWFVRMTLDREFRSSAVSLILWPFGIPVHAFMLAVRVAAAIVVADNLV